MSGQNFSNSRVQFSSVDALLSGQSLPRAKDSRDEDHVRALHALGMQMRDERDDLDRLAETCCQRLLYHSHAPISSARIQPIFFEYSRFSQLTPSS